MPVLAPWAEPGVIEMKCKPLRDWRKVALNLRGGARGHGRFLPEEAPQAMLRDPRRLLAHV